MTKKMTLGITLLLIGFISIIIGIVFIKNAKSENIQISRNTDEINISENTKDSNISENTDEPNISENAKDSNISENKKETLANEQSKIAILDSLITIATADGQLTNNEQKILQEKATELGLNYADYTLKINELLESKKNNKETNIIDKDKEKGDDFEKYIVQKFAKKYFTIAEWAGDKYVNGKYAETTTQPDLKIKFKNNDVVVDFAVECKYRTNYYKNGIEWCSERQLQNYKKFASGKNIPVFIVIGVSGLANEPNELYLIPLNKIETNFLTKDFLSNFRKSNFKDNNLFFDSKTNILK